LRSALERFSAGGFAPVGRINYNGRLYVISTNAFGNPLAESAKAKEQLSKPTDSPVVSSSVIEKTTKHLGKNVRR
jgi:hypothetical protein